MEQIEKKTTRGKGAADAKSTTTADQQAGGEELVSKAYELFEEYRSAYSSEWSRLDTCERLYLGKHWEDVQNKAADDPEPVTPVFQSTIENICADLMDAFPEAIVQPETPEDRDVADIVGALIKQNHDQMGYRREYKLIGHDLLVNGYAVQEVGFDITANNGIGAAFIRYVDNRNVMFDPQCVDIQEGRAVFKFEPKTIEWLEQRYPDRKGEFGADEFQPKADAELRYDKDKSIFLIEYWWREYDTEAERYRVHMAKLAGRQLLEDSREAKPDGYFEMGIFPFLVTPLFRRKGSALGYGMADMFAKMQQYSDKLDQITFKNASMARRNKLLVSQSSGFDAADLQDWSKDVHVGQNLNGVTWFANPPLPNYVIQQSNNMRSYIKEESGSNDFSRGNAGSGITAASAIVALQEASSKRSRMAADQLHEAFKSAVRMEIEFEREFNELPREVLLMRDGQQQAVTFERALLERESALPDNEGLKLPIEFMISIKIQKENRWSVMAHNELVLQMAQLGVLQPPQVLELMIFEGKEEILTKLTQQPQPPSPEEEKMVMEQMAAEEAAAEEEQRMSQAQAAQAQMEQLMQGMPPPGDAPASM